MTDHRDERESSAGGGDAAGTEYRREFDPAVESASTVLVLAVAGFRGTSVEDLPPLRRVVDPDALDALCDPAVGGHAQSSDPVVRFAYAGCRVRVHADGVVALRLAPP